jgi:hypothetical protein
MDGWIDQSMDRLDLLLSKPNRPIDPSFRSNKTRNTGSLSMGEYVDVMLQKPMGIVLEENDPKIKGVYVKSLSQVQTHACLAYA